MEDTNAVGGQSSKRVRNSEEGAPRENDRIPQKRAKTGLSVPSKQSSHRRKSSEFYYVDGNIVVVVENTEFNLHLSRLRKHCDLFAREWYFSEDDEPEDEPEGSAVVTEDEDVNDRSSTSSTLGEGSQAPSDAVEEGQPKVASDDREARYELRDVKAADFTEFLRAFENPVMYATKLPKQRVAISLLRVAHHLECKPILEIAQFCLRKLWPPTPPKFELKKKSIGDAAAIIAIARKFHLPELLKRAYYELLRNPAFWELVVNRRDLVKLSDADMLAMYHARHVLQQEWRTLVLTPPTFGAVCPGDADGNHCVHTSRPRHARFWRDRFIESGTLENGTMDPVCYVDVVLNSPFFQELDQTWCDACLDERKEAWLAAKARWWGMLDELFKIEVQANAEPAQ